MNNDLISRNYVENIVKEEFVDLQDGTEEWRTYVNETCVNILDKVHNAPTVENTINVYPNGNVIVQERPQGEWISDWRDDLDAMSKRGWKCSCCSWRTSYGTPRFCMNCGAEMKGGAE